MEGKDKILETIIAEANTYSQQTKDNADKEYALRLDETKSICDKMIEEVNLSCKKDLEEALSRKKVVATLDGKKIYLAQKKQAIKDVFSIVLNKLVNLDKSTYKSFICRILEKNAENGDRVLVAKNAPLDIKEICDFEVVKARNLKVEKTAQISGGVIIEGVASDINLSFEAIAKEAYNKYETYVAERLFE